jgi:hypothetical protein
MSGYKSSQRQWMPWRVRTLMALFLALGMLIPAAISVFAQDEAAAVVTKDEFCVKGTIINFDETLVGAGWEVTATPVDPPQGQTQTTSTDEDGAFEFDFTAADVGVWNFAATPPEDGWVPVAPYSDNFDITLDYGMSDCITIRFKFKRPVPITVIKINDDYERQEGWIMRAEPAYGNWFASPVEVETDVNGEAQFSLTEGKWIFKERAPSGTKYWAVFPTDGKQELDIEWDDAPYDPLYFKNRIKVNGCIEVYKSDSVEQLDQTIAIPGWKITVKRSNDSVVAHGYTDSQGYVKFDHLPLGPYTVVEENRSGWSPVTPTTFEVTLSGSDCEVVEFFNEQSPAFCIEGRKIDTNGKVGIPGWKISVTALDKGGADPLPPATEDPDNDGVFDVYTDGQGKYRLDFPMDDYRVPGARYRVCEEERSGWLPHTATCQTVVLPKWPGNCANAWDFENQQVGHWESVVYGKHTSSSSSCATTYTVQPGDSLYGIGAMYGVSASSMLSSNSWVYSRPHYYVYPGDVVCIP